nr:retrotransposon like protein [Tanacetum cinerariifolium]
ARAPLRNHLWVSFWVGLSGSDGDKRSWPSRKRQESPTVVYEDNAACIAQLKDEYIKGDKTKHILPKFFFTHDLRKSDNIIVQKVRPSGNQTDLFTKALHTTTFKKLVHGTGMRRLNELN